MKTIGRHLIAEYYGCDRERIDQTETMREALLAAAAAIGVTVLGEAFHRYAPQGVSGVLLIAESHISVHTWPEAAYVAVDIYTCGGIDPRPGFLELARRLDAEETRQQQIVRGLPDEIAAHQALRPEQVVVATGSVSRL